MSLPIGLDIGTSAVRAVQLSHRRGEPRIVRYGEVRLPRGAVKDGEVVDAPAVSEAIRMLWDQHGIKGKKVALGVGNQQVVVRQVDLPYLPEDELRQSLRFQVQEHIPFPIELATLDCTVLEHLEDAEGVRFSRVLVVAAQTDMVNGFVEAVRGAKLEPVSLDLNAFALLRALASDPGIGEVGGELLVGIGATVTNIVVHEGGVPRFVRVLLMGGDAITDNLTGRGGVGFDEAEAIKAQTGLVVDEFAFADEPARLIADRADRLITEISGSLDFYAAQAGAVTVARVVVTGGGSRLRGFAERLQDALQLPVHPGRPLEHVDTAKLRLAGAELDEAEQVLAVAVGLAHGGAR